MAWHDQLVVVFVLRALPHLRHRVAAVVGPAVQPGLEQRLGQEASQQPLGLILQSRFYDL